MKEALAQTGVTTQTFQPGARWYLATTLTERLALLQAKTSHQSATAQSDPERAAQRLKQWKNQPPFQRSEQNFTRRLEMDGLTEESLLTLLAQSPEQIQALFATPPAWLVEFTNAFERQDTEALLAGLPLHNLEDPQTRTISLAIKPLLAIGFGRLQSGIAELQANYSSLPFDPQTISMLLFPHILEQLLAKLTKTLVLELNVARVQGRLQGETPEQRFEHFLQQLTLPENMFTLLEEYPVLARHIVERMQSWAICELEFLQRLCDDWAEICRTFAPAGEPGVLTEVREGAGDTHEDGRSVAILTWSSGLRLVYKPRSLAIDAHFQELLTWLNTQGCQPDFRTFKILNRENYGWCEFVSISQCISKEEIERFYQRLGGYLALLYSLEATDFHAQNLLAAGEYPMLIDLESLFQPRVETDDETDNYTNNYSYQMFRYSVRRVGLLPERIWAGGESAGIDLSGLAGQTGQLTPFGVPTVKGQGTDEMHMARERVEVKLGDHRPMLQGEEIDTQAYEKNIITGFSAVYRLLLQHRDELLTTILPRFAQDEIRVLLRQTQAYTMLQADSFHPNVLRDALDRDRLLDRLWIGVEYYPYQVRLITAERSDLLGDNTPKFATRPDSQDLFTSHGGVIHAFFQEPSLNLVKKCIQHLDEQDMERQIWIIQASFASLALNAAHTLSKRGLQLLPAQALLTRERLINEALSIGDRLQRLALTSENMAGWLVVNVIGEQGWRPVAAGPDLYSGLSGIAFFLAYLGKLSEEQRYTELARLTLKTVQSLVMSTSQPWKWSNIGVFDGPGSLIYLLSHLGKIWQESELYREAEKIVAQIPDLISSDDFFDVMNGSAGCIAALLSLYAVAPSESTLAVAVQCGDHLLSHARPMAQGIGWSSKEQAIPLAGISHGNAGIALSLFRLAAASQEERFSEAAFAAMTYERSLFSPEKRNWPDLRDTPTDSDTDNPQASETQKLSYMTAWCHGAVGVGLARLASLPYNDDAAIREEIAAAVQTTLVEGFGRNHSLCHGDMGNMDLLLTAAHLLPDLYSKEKLEPLQASLLENMKVQGWQSGVPMGIETPSLMIGLAGTGYALLRQAAPDQVPSILSLDPPQAS